jgi:hypothetical protein
MLTKIFIKMSFFEASAINESQKRNNKENSWVFEKFAFKQEMLRTQLCILE